MSPEAPYELIHRRRIDLQFSRIADNRYQIEGRLEDTKTHPFKRQLSSTDIQPGEYIHDIVVRLVIDDSMEVHAASATMSTTPFGICRGAESSLSSLVGLRIGKGWNRKVRELLGGAASCTHMVELLGPMATTAFQGLAPQRIAVINASPDGPERKAKVDSCYAYGADREVVAQLWPAFHRRK